MPHTNLLISVADAELEDLPPDELADRELSTDSAAEIRVTPRWNLCGDPTARAGPYRDPKIGHPRTDQAR